MAIGSMEMPANFKYESVYRKGRPFHEKFSDFWCRHIPMDTGHRAKIFAPFDALVGFDEAIASKEVQYTDRKEMSIQELNEELNGLADFRAPVTISCFVPCTDPNHIACQLGQGTYKAVTGVIQNIDVVTKTLRIADQEISFEDIGSVEKFVVGRTL